MIRALRERGLGAVPPVGSRGLGARGFGGEAPLKLYNAFLLISSKILEFPEFKTVFPGSALLAFSCIY